MCNYMRLSSARQMHTNPSIPVIPPAVKAILSTAFTAITPHSLASANATAKPNTNDTAVPRSNIMYLYFVIISSSNTKCLAKTFFDCFCKEKIREVVVDIVRHLFSRRRTIAYQLFAKKLFGE